MRKHLQFLVASYVATMLLFTINRVVFLIYYHAMAAECSFGELFAALWHGMSLDSVTAGYILVVPLLATMTSVWLPVKERGRALWKRSMRWYFIVVMLLVALIETADMGMFGEWQARIDAQVFIYSPKEMMASVSLANGIAATLYIAATVAVGVWLYGTIVRRLFEPQFSTENRLHLAPRVARVASSVAMVLLAGVLFVMIRGGLTPATANVSKAFFSSKMFLNQAAINPVFSLLSSAFTGDDFDEYNFYSDEEAERLFAEAMRSDAECVEYDRWLNTERPNIVLIVAESMGRTITDAQCDGEAVTPRLNALRGEGVWFENLYASSFRTDRGTVATLSGFLSQPKMSIMKYPNKAAHLSGIARTLLAEGYRTRFFYGGDANFTNTAAYLYATGFEEVIDEDVMPIEGHRSKWGYADDVVAEYATNEIIRRMDSGVSTFDVILTLSSHEPFEVPYRRLSDDMLNSFAFADEVIGGIVERLRATEHWANTLVVIIPDHGYPYPATVGNNSPERHHIPMLWVGGALSGARHIDAYASQTDLAATLLGQMGIAHDDFTFSRDVSRGDVSHFGYWTFNNGFGVIDKEGVTLYDHTTLTTLSDVGEGGERRLEQGKALLQKTFIEIKQL